MGRERALLALGILMAALVAALFVVQASGSVQLTEEEVARAQELNTPPPAPLVRIAVAEPEGPSGPEAATPLLTAQLEVGDVQPAPGAGGPVADPAALDGPPVLALDPVARWLLAGSPDRDQPRGLELLESPGVRDGVDALLAGRADAALLLGPLAIPELDAGLVAIPLVDHVLVPATHPRVPVGNIASSALQQVAAGRVHDWMWLGADAGDIDLLVPTDPAQRDLLERLVLHGQPFPKGVGHLPMVAGAVNTLASRPGSLGFCSLALVQGDDRLNLLRVDQRTASVQAYRTGAWPLGVTLHLVTVGTPRGDAARIHEWLWSEGAQEKMAQRGFVHR